MLLDSINNFTNTEAGGIEKMDKRWDSPWGSTVVDVVAPAFRLILKEYNFTGSQVPMEDEKLRWKEIDELELRLNKLLRYTFHAEVMHIVNTLIVAQFGTTAYFYF